MHYASKIFFANMNEMGIIISNKFPQKEILRDKKLIEDLWKENRKITEIPIQIIYKLTPEKLDTCFKVLFIISKKKFPKASQRNKIRRKLKEIFRLKKNIYYHLPDLQNNTLLLGVSFLSEKILPFEIIQKKLNFALERLKDEIRK